MKPQLLDKVHVVKEGSLDFPGTTFKHFFFISHKKGTNLMQ